jgi:aspartate kinase
MKVYKFGGASLNSSVPVQNVTSIIKNHPAHHLLVVVSAMGETTDMLEKIVAASQSKKPTDAFITSLRDYHLRIIQDLFPPRHSIFNKFENLVTLLQLEASKSGGYDQVYDQVVSMGEVISSTIITHYLNLIGHKTGWLDARHFIKTDSSFREGKIIQEKTYEAMQSIPSLLEKQIVVTQGFIGSDPNGLTTTLGREGSDFSAAIFASALKAESLTVWKDVAGVMNADPRRLPNAVVFDELPYSESAEMTFYGASIIHPKTIKPLANAGIPLYVKSFIDPSLPGTIIHDCKISKLPPLIIFKENQCLISCKVIDYSFINEHQIGVIFQTLSERNIKINVMQSSAISFTFCVDFTEDRILRLIEVLGENFETYYNTNLTLITIKNYDQKLFQEYRNRPGVILEQSSRSTLQVLVKDRH